MFYSCITGGIKKSIFHFLISHINTSYRKSSAKKLLGLKFHLIVYTPDTITASGKNHMDILKRLYFSRNESIC